MAMKILAVNVGSTSIKMKLFQMPEETEIATVKIERIGSDVSSCSYQFLAGGNQSRQLVARNSQEGVQAALEILTESSAGALAGLEELDGVGFKAVHAGDLTDPTLVDEGVLRKMEDYCSAAPIHNPAYIAAIRAFQKLIPCKPLICVFETGFHATIPNYAYVYSVPYEWLEQYGIRRYGFHGSSFRYIAQRTPQLMLRSPEGLRLIACHLGGSSSVCAIQSGQSIDTSMGYSPQSGLPMGSRCGDLDVFAVQAIAERTEP